MRPLLVLVLLCLVGPLAVPSADATSHAPIVISGDAALLAMASSEGWPGAGTLANPIVVDGIEIVSASTQTAIDVHGTTLFLRISRVAISGCSAATAIVLDVVANVTLDRVGVSGCRIGMRLRATADVTIKNATVSGAAFSGLLDESSTRLVVVGSAFEAGNFGAELLGDDVSFRSSTLRAPVGISSSSANTQIVGNTITAQVGIELGLSSGLDVRSNTLDVTNSGIYASRDWFSHFSQNTIRSTAAGIYVTEPFGTVIEANDIAAGTDGIHLSDGAAEVVGNAIHGAGTSGVNATIVDLIMHGNTLTGNAVGVHLAAAQSLVYDNVFRNAKNAEFGSDERVTFNVPARPGPNVVNGPRIGGNFWSDYHGADATRDGFGDEPMVVVATLPPFPTLPRDLTRPALLDRLPLVAGIV